MDADEQTIPATAPAQTDCKTPRQKAGFLDSRPELPLDPIEAPALDGFWWAEEADGIGSPEQFAVLRQGKQVLTLWYTGSADLRTETAYLTSLLEK